MLHRAGAGDRLGSVAVFVTTSDDHALTAPTSANTRHTDLRLESSFRSFTARRGRRFCGHGPLAHGRPFPGAWRPGADEQPGGQRKTMSPSSTLILTARLARWIPAVGWLASYRLSWLRVDLVAGITVAAYLLPAGLGDASLANLRRAVNLRRCGRSANHISLIRHTRPGESRRRTGENLHRIAQVDVMKGRGLRSS